MSQRLEAFTTILPTLPAKRRVVFEMVVAQGENGATLAELVGLLGWAINRISGRVSELVKAGVLREAGTRGEQTIWVACSPRGPIVNPVKRQTVKATFESLFPFVDLFGDTNITIRIPHSAVKHLAHGAKITVKL